jgi:hypothetical protein
VKCIYKGLVASRGRENRVFATIRKNLFQFTLFLSVKHSAQSERASLAVPDSRTAALGLWADPL